jgi:putative lipoprotein
VRKSTVRLYADTLRFEHARRDERERQRTRLATLALLVLVACRPTPERSAGQESQRDSSPGAPATSVEPAADSADRFTAPDSARTFVYECDNRFEYVVRAAGDTTWVYVDHRVVRMPVTPAATGRRYSDGRNTFWTQGEEGLLELDGRAYGGCRNNVSRAIWEHAARQGIDFRAIGQEPGWLLEIDEGKQVMMLADYGEKRVVMPAAAPTIDPQTGRKTYRLKTEAHRLDIEITNQPCADVMSGERYPATVVVTLDGREYRGCGRALTT